MHTLITGTGRCGTGYIAKVLGSAEVPVGHELVFGVRGPDLAARERVEADVSWLAVPYLGTPLLEGMQVVHLVRHPYHVIRSILRTGLWSMPQYAIYRAFKVHHLPGLAEVESQLERAALWYLRWNERIEPHADYRHRVEDDVRDLLDWLGVDYAGKALFGNRRYNSRLVMDCQPDLTALPIGLQDELRAMGERYGYPAGGWL